MTDDPTEAPGIPRAVLDTSVLISRDRHRLWAAAKYGFYEAVWSTFIVGELVRVRVELSIAKGIERAIYRQRINNLIHQLSLGLRVADYQTIDVSGMLSDPDDEPMLAAAKAARAGFVVSHNTKDYPSGGTVIGVRYLTPEDFIALLDTLYPGQNVRVRTDNAPNNPDVRLP